MGILFVLTLFLGGCCFELKAAPLHWRSANGYRVAPLKPLPGKPGFTRLPSAQTGIAFTNFLSRSRYTTNQIYLNGSGVAAGDFDKDGHCDLFFSGLGGRSMLFRNLGDWKFQDVTVSAALSAADLDATGAAFADLDGDRDLDLIVNSVRAGVRLFLNDGRGRFATAPEMLNQNRGGTSLALADIDGDGDLDLYVVNYRSNTLRDMPYTRFRGKNRNGMMVLETVNGRPVTDPDLTNRFTIGPTGGVLEHGEPDVLYLNDGQARFKPRSFTDGTFFDEDGMPLKTAPFDWGLAAMFRDLNGDGAPDLYVCNDFNSPDRIWINDGRGKFRALPRLAARHTSLFSMGVDFADLNHDGFDEWFTADMLSRLHARRQMQMGDFMPEPSRLGEIDNRPQYMHNALFFNRGDGTLAEIAHFSGLQASEWSWAPVFIDVDLDGHEDLLITTGHERDTMNADVMRQIENQKATRRLSPAEVLNLNNLFPRLDVPNLAFRNRGDLTFEEFSGSWGFNLRGITHGIALADLDNDGDQDVITNDLNGEAGVYRNDTAASRIAIRLKGVPPNTQGIGARIRVSGGPVPQSQEVISGGRYLSADDPVRVFAAGSAPSLRIEVLWRNGTQFTITNAAPNSFIEIDQASATTDPKPPGADRKPSTLFTDVSHLLNHRHIDEPFDDFSRQPLLPRKFSQNGPAIAWHDLDRDGRDELIVGSGRSGVLATFQTKPDGTFQRWAERSVAAVQDQIGVVGFGSDLIVAMSNYEDDSTKQAGLQIHSGAAQPVSVLPENVGPNRGVLALADFDSDGDLDLFAGGYVVPGRYPEAAPSHLLRREADTWTVWQRFDHVGLVNGAVFSDLDSDGRPELVLACDWGPVRVFRYADSALIEMTESLGLAMHTGWWNGVNAGDFDADGDLDLVASNWGLNSRYRATPKAPRRLYYADFLGLGRLDIVESIAEPLLGKEVPDRGLKALSAVLPFVEERAGSFERFGQMSFQEVFGDLLNKARRLEVVTLETSLFRNEGNRFVRQALPSQAQWSPAFGVCVGDADGDGADDLFLSQNFFAVQPEVTRNDAGLGLWLRGNGRGALAPVPNTESGINIFGEQRACALSDFDLDGRIDLAVAQNGAETKLYRNVLAKPGLRVRLRGPAGNPNAIGAAMRILYGDSAGPVREIHAGSGYLSQESAVQVLGLGTNAQAIWVRWPGGQTTTSPLPANALQIEIDPAGRLTPQ